MNRLLKYAASTIVIITIWSCKSQVSNVVPLEVHHSGTLKAIMSGDISATIDLDSLQEKEHLFALGAIENLKGEIQIFDSDPNNSQIDNGKVNVNDSYRIKASLLVYSQVKEWDSFKINGLQTKSELESKIFELAAFNNLDTEEPFPFLLNGTVASLAWHIINWKQDDTDHNHKKHRESGLNGNIKNQEVQIIGFYSTKHKAVFTHHTTNMHMHFKTMDLTLAGHVDDLLLNQEITLKLPKQ